MPIDRAAVRRRSDGRVWTLPRPARHGDVVNAVYDETGGYSIRDFEQGFTTDAGRFVTRAEAFVIAADAGQIPKEDAHILFTEDLW